MVHQMTNEDKTLAVSFSAFGLHSDGFFAVPSSQRGTIDRKLEIDLYGADLKFAWLAAPGLTVEPMFSWYRKTGDNGTPLSKNSTEALDFALRVTSERRRFFLAGAGLATAARVRVGLHLGERRPHRRKPSLSTSSTCPAPATGGAFTTRWDSGGKWTVTRGADCRKTSRRNERGRGHASAGARPAASKRWRAFRRGRLRGGRRDPDRCERPAGLPGSCRTGGASKPRWSTGATAADGPSARPRRHRAFRFDRARAIDLHEDLTGGISAGSTFRLPTLNELHRPFRVRNDIVEANPDLDPERFFSLEGGLDWQPADVVTFDATVFHHWIKDAIANVPITDPAQIAAIFGTLPPGGTGSQRQNVDEARVTGVEAANRVAAARMP